MANVAYVTHTEGEDLYLLGRPETPAGVLLTRSDVSAATLNVYRAGGSSPTTAVYTKTLLLTGDPPGASDTECMFDSEQTDDWWPLTGGYTFWQVVRDSDYHLEGGATFTVEVRLTAGHSAPVWPNIGDYGDRVLRWVVQVEPSAA